MDPTGQINADELCAIIGELEAVRRKQALEIYRLQQRISELESEKTPASKK